MLRPAKGNGPEGPFGLVSGGEGVPQFGYSVCSALGRNHVCSP